MTEIDRAIQFVEFKINENNACDDMEYDRDIAVLLRAENRAYVTALTALREMAERKNPKPLTFEELRKKNGEKIHIKFIGPCLGFYEDGYYPYYGKQEQYIEEFNGMLRACVLPLKHHGKSWLAYNHEPERKQDD